LQKCEGKDDCREEIDVKDIGEEGAADAEESERREFESFMCGQRANRVND
jgi:hypothetical protein